MGGGGGRGGEIRGEEKTESGMRIAECVTAVGKQSLITLNYLHHNT